MQRRQLGASYWHAALLSFDNTSFSVEFFSKHPQTRHDIFNITTLRFVILFSKKSRWFCKPLWFRYHVWIRRNASPPCVINMRIFFPCVKFDKVRKQKKHKYLRLLGWFYFCIIKRQSRTVLSSVLKKVQGLWKVFY